MLRCRNCKQVAGPGQQVCLDCGGILDYIPNDPANADGTQEAGAEPDTLRAAGAGVTKIAEQSDTSDKEEDATDGKEVAGPEWKCPKCGETVPGNFDQCWKCMATRSGEPLPEVSGEISEVDAIDQNLEPIDVGSDLRKDDRNASQVRCRGCGSAKIILNVTVVDQGEYSDGRLKVKVSGNPEALIFKDSLYGEIKADICGECGLMDFHVSNPSELYEHVRKSVKARD
jgi:hypothetical protein